MEPEYDEQGNIPGPGPSRVGTIPTWQSEEDEAVLEHENRWGKEFADISKDVIVQAATQGRFTDPPASEQTIDVAVSEVIEMHPNIYKKAVIYHRNNPDAGWSAAMRAAKLSAGSSPENLHRRFMKSPKDRFPDASNIKGKINPDQMKLFGLPTDPASKEAFRIFSENVAKKSGYESMADFRKNVLNKWPSKDQDQLFRQLWEGQGEGYIEHLTQKASHMDWYWDMKGRDRDAVDNVRILFNDNLKNLKDTVEKIVHGQVMPDGSFKKGIGWQGKDLKNRLIVSFEDPMRKVKKDYLKQNPGDIIIKRAGNDQIIGNLGQYLDTLYPQDPLLKQVFVDGVKKLGLTPTQFRKQVLSERIGIIIENSDTLPKNATKRKRYIKQFIDDDMVNLTEQYPFLRSRKSIAEAMYTPGSGVTEADYDKRGQGKNPIPPLGDPRFTKGGPFPSKTEMMNIEKAKRKGYVQGDLMDFLQNLFPDE